MLPFSQWSNKTKIIVGSTASVFILGIGTYWYLDRTNYFIQDDSIALLEKGILLTQSGDNSLALNAFEQSCELNNSDGCYEASKIYGSVAEFSNPEKQSERFMKSLKLGNQTAFSAETDRVFNYLDMPDAQKDGNFTSVFISSATSNDLYFDQKIKEVFDANNSNYKAGVIYYRLFLESKPEDTLKISDFTKLTPVMDDACAKNIISGCAVAADIKTKIFHIEGGTDNDYNYVYQMASHKTRIDQAYKACSNGLTRSCQIVASRIGENLLPSKQFLFAAKEHCDSLNAGESCSIVGTFYDSRLRESGEIPSLDFEPNDTTAKKYYDKSCKLGFTKACELKKQLVAWLKGENTSTQTPLADEAIIEESVPATEAVNPSQTASEQ